MPALFAGNLTRNRLERLGRDFEDTPWCTSVTLKGRVPLAAQRACGLAFSPMLSGDWNPMLVRLRGWAVALVFLGCCLGGSLAPNRTQAQESRIQADFKGAIGLGLVGAELGAVIPALAGMEATWAYIVFPAVGAAGGAVAGYFVLDRGDHVGLSVVALTAGMGLVVPALIATLQLTTYSGPDDKMESAPGTMVRAPASAPVVTPSTQRRLAVERRARRQLGAGSGLVRVTDGQLALAAPGFGLMTGDNGTRGISGVSLALMSGQF
jgi:multidrug transporter EmrE-like cation transporter